MSRALCFSSSVQMTIPFQIGEFGQITRERQANECNVLEGTVEKFVFLGDFIDCQILMGEQVVRVKLPATSDLNQGERVFLQFDPRACILIPAATA